MNYPKINVYSILLLLSFTSFIEIHSQSWDFDYESIYRSHVTKSWKSDKTDNSFHIIQIRKVPGSGKNQRSRIVELDEFGNAQSIFLTNECELPSEFYPFTEDRYISVSYDCSGEPVQTINLFNSQGIRIWKKELSEKYYFNKVLKFGKGFTFLRQEIESRRPDSIKIINLSGDLMFREESFSLSELRESSHHLSIFNALRVDKEKYLIDAGVHDINNDVLSHRYSKIALISNGKIQWIKSLHDKIQRVISLHRTTFGYAVYGRNSERRPVVVFFDELGNEIKSILPKFPSRGLYTQIHITNASVMIYLDKRIHSTYMLIGEIDLIQDTLIYESKIPTKYTRIDGLRIGPVDEKSLIVTGAGHRGPKEELFSNGFVMKVNRSSAEIVLDNEDKVQNKTIQNNVQYVDEVSREVISAKIFPNPAQFKVNVEIDSKEDSNFQFKLYSQNSKEVLSELFFGTTVQVDISGLAPAIYYYVISLQNGKRIISGQLIKV